MRVDPAAGHTSFSANGDAPKGARDRPILIDDGAFHEAMSRAGKLLGVRARSEKETRDRLTDAGFDEPVVDRTIGRLKELSLLDDLDFAVTWISGRAGKGHASARMRAELAAKGVADGLITEALRRIDLDETARAIQLACGRLDRLAGLSVAKQAERIYGFLARRGFAEEICEAATRAVLPPEGWD